MLALLILLLSEAIRRNTKHIERKQLNFLPPDQHFVRISGENMHEAVRTLAPDKIFSSTTARTLTKLDRDLAKARERVKNVKLFKPFVTKQERWVMLRLLKRIDHVFRKYNVTYIIYGGTLLGSHRHHGLVPWDDDVDLLVNKTVRRHLPAMLAAAAPELVLQEAGGHDKIYDGGLSRRTSTYPWRWPYLDVSFFEENSTHLWDHMATYSHWFVYPKWLVLPTHARPFEHLRLPVPRDTLAFLQLTYGRTGTCLTSAYSHMIEDGMPSGRRPCLSLNGSVPFVHRKPCTTSSNQRTDSCVLETLVLGNRQLKPAVAVAEPSFAINEPFSLKLVHGFTQPPYYPSMSDSDL
uniref:Lipopolysaccharide cholinephosphotransferase n=1 Tax=Macrostomum lignano TaxID=282301 RepID=A0A1I8J1S0_9PLAT